MSKIYKTPGVYIEELHKFPPSVARVETAVPIFIGHTEFVKDDLKTSITPSPVNALKALRVDSFAGFQQHFGGAYSEDKVFDIKVNQITPHNLMQQVTVAANPKKFSGFYMFYSIQMFYANSGGPCYILSTGDFSKTFDDADGALAWKHFQKSMSQP
ncbi:hypothetical protein [Pedobacter sp. Leaf194]|uniref:hypothetical protein n=1 Tax=Pedobacter sp. Leaf194 TaxID=1736297 RepID=UPI000703024C|nr:hypothetical protein [Pedobacter sp. Leaf194]KQS32484.1 hypothetical protein ASG14_16495 [Pedobacter sp. Leaf194]